MNLCIIIEVLKGWVVIEHMVEAFTRLRQLLGKMQAYNKNNFDVKTVVDFKFCCDVSTGIVKSNLVFRGVTICLSTNF